METVPIPRDQPADVIDGGAGVIELDPMTAMPETAIRAALNRALDAGGAILDAGGAALDAVEAAVRGARGRSPFQLGCGSVFTLGADRDGCLDHGRA